MSSPDCHGVDSTRKKNKKHRGRRNGKLYHKVFSSNEKKLNRKKMTVIPVEHTGFNTSDLTIYRQVKQYSCWNY